MFDQSLPFQYLNFSARSRENFKSFKVQVFTLTLSQFDEIYYLIPGFNVETVEYKNISFTVWDVGGQDKIRYESFINHLFQNRLLTQICFILLLRCPQGQGQLLEFGYIQLCLNIVQKFNIIFRICSQAAEFEEKNSQ